MPKDYVDINTYLVELQNGNIEALASIYLLTKTKVFSTCLAILKDKGLAEDVMQSTYIRVREKINYYQIGTNGYAWITTIARNLSLNEYNKNSKITSTDFTEKEYLLSSENEASFNDMPIFKVAKEVLSNEELEIVMLYVVSGYKHREIAKILKKPLGTILWSYNNSLKKLKKAIKNKEV